jgi:hypothetical protein
VMSRSLVKSERAIFSTGEGAGAMNVYSAQ